MPWNPDRYEHFRDERSAPFHDLAALVRPRPGMHVVDLGCGTGELTAWLHRSLDSEWTLGIDSSPEMLARARQRLVGSPRELAGLSFATGRIEEYRPNAPVDLCFSNAAIHWVEGHHALLARLRSWLAPGGQLAVQVPANHDHPSHVVAAEVAREEPFREELGGYERVSPVLAPEEYALLLKRLGFPEQHVRLQVYMHELASRDSVVEWVRGTLLTDYENRLRPRTFADFLERYRERLLPRLAADRPYAYPFKRILMWGIVA